MIKHRLHYYLMATSMSPTTRWNSCEQYEHSTTVSSMRYSPLHSSPTASMSKTVSNLESPTENATVDAPPPANQLPTSDYGWNSIVS